MKMASACAPEETVKYLRGFHYPFSSGTENQSSVYTDTTTQRNANILVLEKTAKRLFWLSSRYDRVASVIHLTPNETSLPSLLGSILILHRLTKPQLVLDALVANFKKLSNIHMVFVGDFMIRRHPNLALLLIFCFQFARFLCVYNDI